MPVKSNLNGEKSQNRYVRMTDALFEDTSILASINNQSTADYIRSLLIRETAINRAAILAAKKINREKAAELKKLAVSD